VFPLSVSVLELISSDLTGELLGAGLMPGFALWVLNDFVDLIILMPRAWVKMMSSPSSPSANSCKPIPTSNEDSSNGGVSQRVVQHQAIDDQIGK